MTTFGWKRKIGDKIHKNSDIKSVFNPDEGSDSRSSSSTDWVHHFKKKKCSLGDNREIKAAELKDEGAKLAEKGLYSEAISRWDQALELTPSDGKILEMKAQALLQVSDSIPALQTARKAVMCDPTWWIAYQTLGHAQLDVGDIKLAIISFSKAIHLNPASEELWQEDLKWALQLFREKEELSEQLRSQNEEGEESVPRVYYDKEVVIMNPGFQRCPDVDHDDILPCHF